MSSHEILTAVAAWLPLVKDGVLTAAAIVGACCAIVGLNTWKRQLRGNADFDVARRVLRAVFHWRNAVKGFRLGNSVGGDFLPDRGSPKSTPQPPQERDNEPMLARWRRVDDKRVDLDAELLEAEALWGEDLRKLLQPALDLEWDLAKALQNQRAAINPQTDPVLREALREKEDAKSRRASLFAHPGEDKFAKEFAEGLKPVEDYLRRKFQRSY